jgi:hypothetical protein
MSWFDTAGRVEMVNLAQPITPAAYHYSQKNIKDDVTSNSGVDCSGPQLSIDISFIWSQEAIGCVYKPLLN